MPDEPFFTTDTASALRASEINAEVMLMAKNGVDGVYDDDPRVNPNAKKLDRVSYDEIIKKDLKVMDQTAATLCKDNHMEIIVFNMNEDGNILRAAQGEKIGTLIKN